MKQEQFFSLEKPKKSYFKDYAGLLKLIARVLIKQPLKETSDKRYLIIGTKFRALKIILLIRSSG